MRLWFKSPVEGTTVPVAPSARALRTMAAEDARREALAGASRYSLLLEKTIERQQNEDPDANQALVPFLVPLAKAELESRELRPIIEEAIRIRRWELLGRWVLGVAVILFGGIQFLNSPFTALPVMGLGGAIIGTRSPAPAGLGGSEEKKDAK